MLIFQTQLNKPPRPPALSFQHIIYALLEAYTCSRFHGLSLGPIRSSIRPVLAEGFVLSAARGQKTPLRPNTAL